MRSVLYVRSQSANYSGSNPMAVAMRNAVANQYGFVPSNDPFEFSRQLTKAKADAIAAELNAKNKARKAEESKAVRLAKQASTEARKERQAMATKEATLIRKSWVTSKIINTERIIPMTGHPRSSETVAERIERLNKIERDAELREMQRQYGKYGTATKAPEPSINPWAELKKAHMVDTEKAAHETAEREQLIGQLQDLGALREEHMFNFTIYDLRREIKKVQKIHNVVKMQAEKAPATGFDGYSIGEDERERVIFTTRRVHGQLPRNTDRAPMVELLANLKAHCERKGLKWFAELWPNATQVACPVAPQGQRLDMSSQKKVAKAVPDRIEPAVEKLWTAIFGALGAGN